MRIILFILSKKIYKIILLCKYYFLKVCIIFAGTACFHSVFRFDLIRAKGYIYEF